MTEQDLRRRWLELMAELRLAGPVAEATAEVVVDDLLRRHREPHRRYHSLEHLTEVHAALDDLPAASGAVRAAAWFHDAVHDPRAADDEERSAAVAGAALRDLGVAGELAAEVERLVRLTATHDPADDDPSGQTLCDADLSILAAGPERYVRYRRQVRAEYGHLDDERWRSGRAAVLDAFLDRERIYRTAEGRLRWEERARENLRAERLLLG